MRILTIQYVRGLAALLVVAAHNSAFLSEYWVNHIPGALGVDVFFIVSGFIMTFITRQAPEGACTFLIKRFFRIWPPLFLVWLASLVLVYHERTLSQMSCVLYFCLQDYSKQGPTFGYSPLGPPWTLSYEVIFYAVFALSMSLCYRYRSFLCALIFMAAMVGFQLFYNGSYSLSSQISPEMVVSHWWQAWIKIASNTVYFEFIAGMFLAELMVNDKFTDSRFIRALAWGALIFAFVFVIATGPQVFGMSGGFWPALIIMVSVITLSCHTETVRIRWLSFLGDISYSLYLVHYPVMLFIKNALPSAALQNGTPAVFLLSVAVSTATASVMFRLVEMPSVELGKKITRNISLKRSSKYN
ncbi:MULTISPECIES: acyltransferase family protein [Pantoea]|nr:MULTISPECIES: acyltransferase [Pantoea]MDN4129683.1 acyltransferase [Pantoea ananatis]MDN4154168.1 acyltransferase [Pantoea ananatis]MDR6299285.1 exopolysaccharide production protein ExoZ [Pantoea dispersa]